MKYIILIILNITTVSYAQSCEKLPNALDYLKTEIELTIDKGLQETYQQIYDKYYNIFFDQCILSQEKGG